MRALCVAYLALALLTLPTAVAAHDEEGGTPERLTVRGEVLDMACYLSHDGKGPQHRKCALRCAEQGQPIGLLTKDGRVYLLMADHADTSAFDAARKLAGQEVEVEGEPAGRDGLHGLTVLAVKKI